MVSLKNDSVKAAGHSGSHFIWLRKAWSNGYLFFVHINSHKCLSTANNGRDVTVAFCNGSSQQQWKEVNGLWKNRATGKWLKLWMNRLYILSFWFHIFFCSYLSLFSPDLHFSFYIYICYFFNFLIFLFEIKGKCLTVDSSGELIFVTTCGSSVFQNWTLVNKIDWFVEKKTHSCNANVL